MNFNIAFLIDVSILALLAATVFLAFRLSLSLRTFKESRFEMEGLVNRLSANIDKAERAIQGMQNTARKSGVELDEVISDAKRLRDELKVMSESGNSLASRLENLAMKNRELVDQIGATSLANAGPIEYNRE
jgi:methyl-accepting chemotaxis protein